MAVCEHLSVCVRVFDGDHARSAAALSNREHVRESSRESATKESIGTKRRFFFFLRSLLLFFKFFSLASFLAFSLQRFKYRISRVSDYIEYDNTRMTTWCWCCKSKNFYNFRIWSPMTSYPILWSGLWTDCVAISTSVHTFVRTYVRMTRRQNEVRKENHMTNLALLLHKSAAACEKFAAWRRFMQ